MPFDGAMSPLHWLIIAVVALMVLGPDRMPSIARQLVQFKRGYANAARHVRSELRDVVSSFDLESSGVPSHADDVADER